jgi:antitoxin VapB
MALNIKNLVVEKLAREISEETGESKTQAIRRALEDRRSRLRVAGKEMNRAERIRRFLLGEVWPRIPATELGRRLTKIEEDALLGYGSDGA